MTHIYDSFQTWLTCHDSMPKKHATYNGLRWRWIRKENLPGLAYLRGLLRTEPYGRGLANRTILADRAGLPIRWEFRITRRPCPNPELIARIRLLKKYKIWHEWKKMFHFIQIVDFKFYSKKNTNFSATRLVFSNKFWNRPFWHQ